MTQPPIKKFVKTTNNDGEVSELGEQHTQMMLKFARETQNCGYFSPAAQTPEEIAASARELSKHIKVVVE